MTSAYCPDAGDIVWIDFNPQAGREQRGRRPAMVLSPRAYNQRAKLCVMCPITNQGKGYPFECEIPSSLSTTGFVLSDQVKSLSWEERGAEFIEQVPQALLSEVRAKIKALLAIP